MNQPLAPRANRAAGMDHRRARDRGSGRRTPVYGSACRRAQGPGRLVPALAEPVPPYLERREPAVPERAGRAHDRQSSEIGSRTTALPATIARRSCTIPAVLARGSVDARNARNAHVSGDRFAIARSHAGSSASGKNAPLNKVSTAVTSPGSWPPCCVATTSAAAAKPIDRKTATDSTRHVISGTQSGDSCVKPSGTAITSVRTPSTIASHTGQTDQPSPSIAAGIGCAASASSVPSTSIATSRSRPPSW